MEAKNKPDEKVSQFEANILKIAWKEWKETARLPSQTAEEYNYGVHDTHSLKTK
jgi:hypothetical protein